MYFHPTHWAIHSHISDNGKDSKGADVRLNFSAEIPLSVCFLLFMCINMLQSCTWVASSERHPRIGAQVRKPHQWQEMLNAVFYSRFVLEEGILK